MFCQRCGKQLDGTAKFCGNCGARTPLNNDPAVLSSSLVSPEISTVVASQTLNRHLRVMGILWAIYSGFRILMAVWTLVFSRMFLPTFMNVVTRSMPQDSDPGMAPLMRSIVQMMSGFYAISAIFAILAGSLGFWVAWALLKHQPNGRTLALVVACLSLISIPFGTALGVYTLVILLPAKADRAYQQMAAAE
ncbi:MAG TPA: zinc ribbon domain-containing protein [Candidatus Acidoferrales bacterium]|nr:zinc ribbon domain-containing protein [Candidatus Acidoferrales bacterium]